MRRSLRQAATTTPGPLLTLLLFLLLSGCSGLGGILDSPPAQRSGPEMEGAVVRVDTSAREVIVNVDDRAQADRLRAEAGERVVEYDDQTVVVYQGETYRPDGLERGDIVAVELSPTRERLATRFTVLQNVRTSTDGDQNDQNDWTSDRLPSVLTATVLELREDDRAIEVERDSSTRASVIHYDSQTIVAYDGREYRPEALERGDEIRIEGSYRGDRYLVDRITVEQNVRATDGWSDDRTDDDNDWDSDWNDDQADDDDADGDWDEGRDGDRASFEGRIVSIDIRQRSLELSTESSGRERQVWYDDRTTVELDGRLLRAESLREGDTLSIVGTWRDDRFLADRIAIVDN